MNTEWCCGVSVRVAQSRRLRAAPRPATPWGVSPNIFLVVTALANPMAAWRVAMIFHSCGILLRSCARSRRGVVQRAAVAWCLRFLGVGNRSSIKGVNPLRPYSAR